MMDTKAELDFADTFEEKTLFKNCISDFNNPILRGIQLCHKLTVILRPATLHNFRRFFSLSYKCLAVLHFNF